MLNQVPVGQSIAVCGLPGRPATSAMAARVKLGEMPGNVGQNTTGGTALETALRGISVSPLTPDNGVTSVNGFNRAMHSAGNQTVVLLVDRNGTTSFVVVQ